MAGALVTDEMSIRIKREITRAINKKRRGIITGFLIEVIPIKKIEITQIPKLIKCISEEPMALFFA